jgi:hypothetical protein
MTKVAAAQALLRKLHEKQAGLVAPLVIGGGLVAGAHVAHKGIQKAREYNAGFQPGYIPQE